MIEAVSKISVQISKIRVGVGPCFEPSHTIAKKTNSLVELMADRAKREPDLRQLKVGISTSPKFVKFLFESLIEFRGVERIFLPNFTHFSQLIPQSCQLVVLSCVN